MGKSASSDSKAGAQPAIEAGGGACGLPRSVEIQFPSCAEYLAMLRPATRWFAKKCGFAERDASRVVLAVVEAVTNIIRHAYDGDPNQRITLRMSEIVGGLEIELLDHGKSISAADLERRSAAKSRSPEKGGLGVKMMKTCMDHFKYEPRPEGGSRLILRKMRGTPCEEATP